MSDDRSQGLLRNKTFYIRTATGFVMTCLLVAIFTLGYDVMAIFFLVLSLLAAFELNRVLNNGWGALSIISYAAVFSHYIFIRFFTEAKFFTYNHYISKGIVEQSDVAADNFTLASIYIILIYVVALILMLGVFVLSYPKYELQQVFGAFLGIFYTGVTLSLLYLLRITPPYGAYLVWLAVLSSWGCDIPAYFFGMKLGKHQLVPRLSPKKSVEGAIGGVFGSVCFAVIYGFCVQQYVPDIQYAPLVFGCFCLVGAVVSQIGDLAASAIK